MKKEQRQGYKLMKIKPDVHRELTSVTHKNESYSEAIGRLVQFYKKSSADKTG